MLRRFCGNGWGAFSAGEAAAIQELASSQQQLLMDGGFAEVRSEAGYTACAVFLSAIDKAARTLCLEVSPRAYRCSFTANYRALFPDNARHYRVDVFEASVDQHSAIWVNGDKFELSAEAINYAEAVQQAWLDLGVMLNRWRSSGRVENQRPTRSEFATSLAALDVAWAQFECKYINELIAIEEQARQFIVKAVSFESQLRMLPKGNPEHREAEKNLVSCIAHLNSVANFKRKGRDDFNISILESARAVLQRLEKGHQDQIMGMAKETTEILATDVTASYDAMRSYLFEVSSCVERVDPHLCNNAGLVARLVDWEESWEVGLRYVRETSMFEGVCDLVSQVKSAQSFAPAFTEMVEDCDVELFLVLPRLVLLSFLADPTAPRLEPVKSLLPHRFGKEDPELRALVDHFNVAMEVLQTSDLVDCSRAPGQSSGRGYGLAAPRRQHWEVLVKRAVDGITTVDPAYAACSVSAQKVIEEFVREMERWSLELQRHCPEDWNQFSAVLVQCLTGGIPKEPPPQFEV